MAKTIGEFIHDLVKKSGMNADDEAIKNFLMNGELVKIEIPEEIENGINKSLISIKDAKNNHPDIKPHYTELSLKTVDGILERFLEENEVDESIKAEILSERSTYKRVPMLLHKVAELERRKSSAGKTDKEAYQKQIDELHKQIRLEKERVSEAEKNFQDQLKKFKLDTKKSALLGQYNTVYDELDPEIKMTTLLNILEKKLQDKEAILTFDENENVVLLKKDGTNFYSDSNQQVSPKQFVESVLSETKILKTATKPAEPANQNQRSANNPPFGQQPQQVAADTAKSNPILKELLQSSLGDLEKNSGIPIMGS